MNDANCGWLVANQRTIYISSQRLQTLYNLKVNEDRKGKENGNIAQRTNVEYDVDIMGSSELWGVGVTHELNSAGGDRIWHLELVGGWKTWDW